MSSSCLVHNDPLLIFDGTNYNDWRNRMLNYFRDINPYIEQILDMGFSPLEDEENSYLDAQASKVVFMSLSNAVALSAQFGHSKRDIRSRRAREVHE